MKNTIQTSLEHISWKLLRETRHSTRRTGVLGWLCELCLGPGVCSAYARDPGHHDEWTESGIRARAAVTNIPPVPKGVTELKFNEFFVTPVGPRGLELTDKLRQLDGQRVRILGYMVRQEEAPTGSFLLAPLPAQVHEHENGLADDLPASTLHVFSPSHREEAVPYTPQLLLLTGTLSVGNRTGADGRISTVRLTLDPTARGATLGKSAPTAKGAERLVPSHKPATH